MFPKSRPAGRKARRQNSFTLVELLTVMSIIAVLAALTLAAASAVIQHAARSRASGEIAAFKTALDSYRVDNGGYPVSDGILATNNYAASDGSGTEYQTNAAILFQALTGETNYGVATSAKSYMNLRANQVGSGAAGSFVKDPWGLAYGYSSGTASASPYNGTNSYDLWSTGGVTYTRWNSNNTLTNAWINNWQ